MVDLVRVTGDNQVGVRVRLEDGSYFVAPATVQIKATGAEISGDVGSGITVDENGDVRVVQADTIDRATLDLSSVGNTMEMPIGKGQGVLGVDITGLSGSGATVVAESTVGLLWFPMNQLRVGAGGAIPMTATEDSSFRSSVVAKTRVRLRVTVAGTGTAQVAYSLSTNASLVQLSASIPPGNNKLGSVGIDGTVPVSGTFWPTTQPVSGAVSVSNFPATQPVSGSVSVGNFPATQAVSGSVSVSNFPATQTIAGTVTVAPSTASVAAIVPIRVVNQPTVTLKSSAGNFYSAYMVAGGVATYLMALDRSTALASGTTITTSEIMHVTPLIPANNYGSLAPTDVPDRFVNGCVIIATTSLTTYTPPSTAPNFIRGKVI